MVGSYRERDLKPNNRDRKVTLRTQCDIAHVTTIQPREHVVDSRQQARGIGHYPATGLTRTKFESLPFHPEILPIDLSCPAFDWISQK